MTYAERILGELFKEARVPTIRELEGQFELAKGKLLAALPQSR